MGENSKIEWTDHTFNPWIGCQKVSPGCDHCYAEAMMDHRYHKVEWGPHGERKRTTDANWRKPLRWDDDAKAAGKRARVFCASLADWLDNKAPQAWRNDLAGLIYATPWLDWLLLTKRPENYDCYAPWDKAPANVWLGTTAENEERYRHRWNMLARIPATVHFISYEPALGPLGNLRARPSGKFPNWIIMGGESGSFARTMDPEWARDMRDACEVAGIAFFMKQMTRKAPIPPDLMVRQFPR